MSADRNDLILQYRAAHDDAIENYDFDRAKMIMREIQKMSTKHSSNFTEMGKIARQLQSVRGQKMNEYSDFVCQHEEIRLKYLQRFHQILEKHDSQIKNLRDEMKSAISREKRRPVPEANDLFLRAKLLGRSHQYENAKIIYNEACYVHNLVTERRIRACRKLYREQQMQIEDKQNQELKVFLGRIVNDFQQLEVGHFRNAVILNNRERIKEFKAGCWPPENYSVGPFHVRPTAYPVKTRRRAASATRTKRNKKKKSPRK
ncbi:hypothetical protein TRFO_13344 [Tritrichomonas foetus]|uniref:Uncharacterized protein n=1 Tax=Tritrichomonas foetus TaxID=1144522 RepID=A0A1J4KY75_9EUKA|nr:hypothetical protein TRFO_13344 [Tritrichomonas foetus]|eukprot:OHT16191.1 hypothetical protein TRFO_13344 [Tritrichomonas foetus]